MKTTILRLYALIALTSMPICSCVKRESVIENNKHATDEFIAQMSSLELFNRNVTYTDTLKTKTITKDGNKVIWCEDDNVSILRGQNINEEFVVKKGFGGKTTTTLQKVESSDFPAGSGDSFDANIAYYPYGNIAYCGAENNHSLEVSIPYTQVYHVNSFGSGAFPMVAVTTSKADNTLSFKNLFGMLKLQLKSSPYVCKVKSIIIKGNNREKLSGEAIVKCSNTEDPTISFLESEANDYIKLDCGEGVELSPNTVTEFWITLPPITFSNGITASIELTDGTVVDKSSRSALTITRSVVKPMSVLTVNTEYLEQKSSLILKELYYCGSKTPSGGSYFRDQYYELYNNSSSVQYLDGLCIGNINPVVATANLPSYPGENPDDYLYFLTVWQIPGIPQSLEGSTHNYPIQPGESVIIAQMADNHQRAELNPACPVNLLSAEFEAYLKSTAIIKDNPAINMHLAFWPRPTYQWLVAVFGGAYAIFYPDHEIDPNEYTSPINSTQKLCKISIDCVVDAVELVNDESKMKLKRMPAVLDAGATTVSATYCGKSVARKIKSTLEDGRIIYQDTNNSTEDFEVMDKPVPRRNGAKIPAWNTWAN